jgi:hypothetical protein
VGVGVAEGVAVRDEVTVNRTVPVGVIENVEVWEAVALAVPVFAGEGVTVPVEVPVGVEETPSVWVRVALKAAVWVAEGVLEGVKVGLEGLVGLGLLPQETTVAARVRAQRNSKCRVKGWIIETSINHFFCFSALRKARI